MIKRIGIMGGTFNPIHNGHLLIANEVLNQLNLDEVLFIPNNIPNQIEHKQVHVSGQDRLQMVKLAIQDNPKFKVSTVELQRNQPSYMYDTVKELNQKYHHVEWYLILGADEINLLAKWYQVHKLSKLVHFVSVNRLNKFGKTMYPTIKVYSPTFAISSTEIRKRCQQHKTIKYLVPNSVIKYIKGHKLYQND